MSAPSLVANGLASLGRIALSFSRAAFARIGLRPDRAAPAVNAGVAAALTLCAGVSAALVAAAGPALTAGPARAETVTRSVQPPDLTPEITELARLGSYTPKHRNVAPDDTILSLLSSLGVNDGEVLSFLESTPRLKPLLMLQTGQHVAAGVTDSGELEYLRLYLDGPNPSDARTIEVSRIGSELIADVLPFSFSTMETVVSGRGAKGLDATAAALDIPDDVAGQLLEVWDGADDPVSALTERSTVRLVYERKYADGRFVRNGRLLAAQIIDDAGVHEAFWFSDGRHPGSFYTLDGRSASQTFLRVPLDIKDVSSEFAPLRRHPITGVLRPHNGTDLRAPMGSRILAAADGRVTRVAYQARGYGNYVEIDHGLGRRTLYAHMQRVQKGIRAGMRVEKGQLIGLVGRTGLATGPHLHYELIIDGVQINPATADLPDTENLSAYQLAKLRAQAHPFVKLFEETAKSEGLPSPERLMAEAAERAAAEAERAAAEAGDAAPAGGRLRAVSNVSHGVKSSGGGTAAHIRAAK